MQSNDPNVSFKLEKSRGTGEVHHWAERTIREIEGNKEELWSLKAAANYVVSLSVMQQQGSGDGFAAVKAKWDKKATKFGSPMSAYGGCPVKLQPARTGDAGNSAASKGGEGIVEKAAREEEDVGVVENGEQGAKEASSPRQKKGWWRARTESTDNPSNGCARSNEGKGKSLNDLAAVEHKDTTAPPPKTTRRPNNNPTKQIKPKVAVAVSLASQPGSEQGVTEFPTRQKKDWWVARKESSSSNEGGAAREPGHETKVKNDTPAPPKSPCKSPRVRSQPKASSSFVVKEVPPPFPSRPIVRRSKSSDAVKNPLIPATAATKTGAEETGLDKTQQGELPKQAPRRTGRSKQQAIRERQLKDEVFANLPVFTHSDAEEDVILQALYNKDVFTNVTTGQMKQLVAAFDKTRYEAGDIIVHEGDTTDDYFYVVDRGIAEATLEEDHICTFVKGDSFGELSLLYASPHPFTVLALDDTDVFRIDGDSFRIILKTECKRSQQKKLRLLQGINFLEHVPACAVKLLSEAMTPREFRSGETVLKKGQDATAFFVVSEGKLLCKDGTSKPWKTGNYFGDDDLATCEKVKASVVATTQSMVFSIGKETFEKALGSMSALILKDQDIRRLSEIPFIKGAVGSREQMAALTDLLREKSFAANENIMVERETTKAALYLVRKGSVVVKRTNSSGEQAEEAVATGGHFGGTLIQRAHGKSRRSIKSPYSVMAAGTGVTVVSLAVKDFWSIVDPSRLVAKEKPQKEDKEDAPPSTTPTTAETAEEEPLALPPVASTARSALPLPVAPMVEVKKENLQKHVILGEGTFGQVWLVSDKSSKEEGSCRTYALKIQSKSFLVEENQAEAVIQEKIMMEHMKHPFLIQLHTTYQDKMFVYMVLDFIQGGELFTLMHEDDSFTITEPQAKFYALCIADVIAYLHRGKYVYRDLKPENIMIDALGYVKLIDFGFCKYLLAEKTYTLCGTPGYLAPEVVTVEGHDWSSDLWSLGIVIYEMLTGESPFYYDGIDQMELFESIVYNPYVPPANVSPEAADIMGQLLAKNPARRLGASGESHVVDHPWFSDLDLDALRRRDPSIPVPWTPKLTGPMDTSYFNDWSDLEREAASNNISATGDNSKKGNILSARDAKIFEGVF